MRMESFKEMEVDRVVDGTKNFTIFSKGEVPRSTERHFKNYRPDTPEISCR